MKKQFAWYMPKVGAKFKSQNQDVLAKIAVVPRVKHEAIQTVLQCTRQVYGFLIIFEVPAIKWGEDQILITFPNEVKYIPVEGMIEILGSEFVELNKKEALDI